VNRRYFGTDGIRGRVGEAPITPDCMLKLGWACGRVFTRVAAGSAADNAVVVGRDTRASGDMFESALAAGLAAAGVDVKLLGLAPTPAVALMARTQQARAGVVISASHNPCSDNGIKLFDGDGCKLDESVELAIEEQLDAELKTVDSSRLGRVARVPDAAGRYVEFCKSTVPRRFGLHGLKIVVDCAHGATCRIAPRVFPELGAEVVDLGAEPDGFNINDRVGSTDPRALRARVVEERADLGIAFDGDGDRVVFVDSSGAVVDGDELLFIIACHRRSVGVVGTRMSNLGMELALKERGIGFARAEVGDRYVNAMMREKSWPLGGEPCGHIVCSELSTTGDGIVAALQVLLALREADTDLESLRGGVNKFPQRTINVETAGKKAELDTHREVAAAVAEIEAELGDRGRVLVRPSGTEPLVRVTVEGEDPARVDSLCEALADRVRMALEK